MSWYEQLAVFDLETTGVDVETARIVTAHIGVIDAAGNPTTSWSWLLDPEIPIPDAATSVHGVTTEHAQKHGSPAALGVSQIVGTLRSLQNSGVPLVIYNAPYDLTVLDREAQRHLVERLVNPHPVIDPLVIDKAMDTYRRGKRTLSVTCEHYGVELVDAHDASADAIAAGRLAQALARQYVEELGVEAAELHRLQITWAAAQAADFEAYMRRVRDPEFRATGVWPVR